MKMDVKSKPTMRRYSREQKEQAVRMVFALREELGTSQGTVKRVADQLGIGVESLRSWGEAGRDRYRGSAGHDVG